jgi:SsrA-binding protein
LSDIRTISVNRKARREYEVEETVEAGLVLLGSEVKSLRAGSIDMGDAYVQFRAGEAFLVGAHIAPYAQANRENHDPLRERKLLLRARQIRRLMGKVTERGYSLVPLAVYFRGAHAKVELGLGRGRKLYDRRADIRKREANRDMERAMRQARER